MSKSDNTYASDRGLENSDSDYRESNRDVTVRQNHAPEPGAESVGPLMFNLVQETRRAMEVQNTLIRAAMPLMNERVIVEKHAGQTDANGNLDLPLFRVTQGDKFVVTRCIVEDATHTPGTPFAVANGWMALIAGDKFAVGSVRDFAPNPPLSNSAFIPWIFSDGNSEAAVFRGGEIVSLHVSGTVTLANIDIFCTLQGHLSPG